MDIFIRNDGVIKIFLACGDRNINTKPLIDSNRENVYLIIVFANRD